MRIVDWSSDVCCSDLLGYHRFADTESRCEFHHQGDDREIPWRDRADHAQRRALLEDLSVLGLADRLDRQIQLGKVAQRRNGAADLEARLVERLALLAREQRAEVVFTRFPRIGEAAPLVWPLGSPRRET